MLVVAAFAIGPQAYSVVLLAATLAATLSGLIVFAFLPL